MTNKEKENREQLEKATDMVLDWIDKYGLKEAKDILYKHTNLPTTRKNKIWDRVMKWQI